MSTAFYNRFRQAIAAYAEGVHQLGPPASAAALKAASAALGGRLPVPLADFLRSWDGASLFAEEVQLFSASLLATANARARAEEEWPADELWVGETAAGDRIVLEPSGAVSEREAETGMRWGVASSFERLLDRVIARGQCVYDHEGEFKEGIFSREGDELSPKVALRQAERVVRLDPHAPKGHYELGQALRVLGRKQAAEQAFAEAARLDSSAVWALFDLGKLRWERGDAAGSAQAFAQAIEGDPSYEHAGFFAAWAARAAAGAGDAAAARAFRARALALEPQLASRQVQAAEHELEAGNRTEAVELAELALAVAPTDLGALELKRRAKAR